MAIPLEDSFADIIGKAQRGLQISDSELAEKAGVSAADVKSLREGNFQDAVAAKIAPLLDLNATALADLAHKRWQPAPVRVEGLASFNTPFEDMTVNSYLVFDAKAKIAVAFDTGADCSGMLDLLREHNLKLSLILLTHTHGDHVYDLDRLREKTGAQAFVSAKEPIDGATSFEAGNVFDTGSGITIQTRQTWGHSQGGITYVVQGLEQPVAIVGDAVFAGSMGGGGVSYADALRTNRAEIFSLPDKTVICPGHGPMTTVGEEKKHNPFFA